MSAKARDPRGRWRSVSVSFRLSPEEVALMDSMVQISGLTKQEYLARRVTQKDVVVQGNPRVYKALKNQLEQLCKELLRLSEFSEVSEDLLELIRVVVGICGEMKKVKGAEY